MSEKAERPTKTFEINGKEIGFIFRSHDREWMVVDSNGSDIGYFTKKSGDSIILFLEEILGLKPLY